MAKTLKQIGEDESFSNSIEFLSGKKVKSTFSFKRNAESPRYAKEIVYDFSGLSEQQLLELAVKTVQIRAQAMLRNLDAGVMLNSESLAEVDVLKDIVSAEKKTADPMTAAVRSMMKATGVDAETARTMIEQAKEKASRKPERSKKAA